MMTQQLRTDFKRFLDMGGYCTPPGRVACAMNKAKTLRDWRKAETKGSVRLRALPEQDDYFSVYGEPEGYTNTHGNRVSAEQERAAIERQIERDGCWIVISEYRCSECGSWQTADSIGMCIYSDPLDPFQNDYVSDLMRAALDKI